MVCGGFGCSKNALVTLNCLYIIVSFILIGVGAYAKAAAVIVSLSVVGGIIASGVFLLFFSIIGLFGAIRHHQVILFFYMIILFILFLFQFSFGVVCLAVNKNQQIDLMRKAWMTSSNYTKSSFQEQLDCCGFEDPNLNSSAPLGHPTCSKLPCCSDSKDSCCTSDMTVTLTATQCSCQPCLQKANEAITTAFGWSGSLGLIFSFTEILGVWLAFRYRHLRDPRANPDAFL
ncbi:tetraspanin-31-like isoform X1 [Mya arenaria]|uniref:tetraspanin-31-like isoform X1 n=1 Tax=Mya arenaria TaxID=6604 RepID=UPI0022E8F88B|nr:tetraspanin-31-like isoform X1 [Mya arenaria]